ncbi:MAG: hypothetical protein HAW64_00155 [Alphaproteobacteria bacterium]|nr:hypothetical protein [Alphaproteobacteria bacterium]
MRALYVDDLAQDFSGCDLREGDTPAPQPDEVLVKIRATALGFSDLLMTRGGYQHKPDLPACACGSAP